MAGNVVTALMLTALFLISKGQDDNITKSPVDILRIQFEFNLTRIPNLAIDLLSTMAYKNFTNETIYLKDVLNLFKVENESTWSLDQVFSISRLFNINLTMPFANNKIESAFSELNISVIKVYQTFISELQKNNISATTITNAFKAIRLNRQEIYELIEDNGIQIEAKFFKILETGDYSQSNFDNFLQILNLTDSKLSDILVDIIGDKSMDDVIKLVPATANILKLVFESLKNTTANIEKVEPFATILAKYIRNANAPIILATAFTPTSFISLHKPWFFPDLKIIGELFKDNSTKKLSNLTVSSYHNDFLNLSATGLNNSYKNISNNYILPLQNCSVIISKNVQSVMVKTLNVTVDKDYIYATLDNETVPNLASPFICNNIIYGLSTAEKRDNDSWQFLPFGKSELTTTPPTAQISSTTPTTEIQSTTSNTCRIISDSILIITFFALITYLF